MSTNDTQGAATAPAGTILVVDGSNIATEGRTVPSLSQLDDAVRALLAERTFDQVVVVVDATFGHRIDRNESRHFEEAILAGELVTPPAGTIGRGDAFILQIADRAGAIVFSNDSFQEFHGTYDWLFDEGRLIGGKPVTGIGWVFVHRNPVRGPTSRKAVRDAKRGATGSPRGGRRAAAGAARSRSAPGARPRQPAAGPNSPSAPRCQVVRRGSRGGRRCRPGGGDHRRAGRRAGTAGRRTRKGGPPINEPLAFLSFVTAHPVAGEVEGEVVEFSSHGAYVDVDGARCYLSLKSMGEPAPKSA